MITERKKLLKKRMKISAKRPKFVRQESWRYKRLKPNWRRPKGIDNKMREKRKGYPRLVSVGYRGPTVTRGLHPSGYTVVHVANVYDLEKIDPKEEAIIIRRTVGERKRMEIIERAEELNIKIINPPTAIGAAVEEFEGAPLEEEYELLESGDEDFEFEEDLEESDEDSEESNRDSEESETEESEN